MFFDINKNRLEIWFCDNANKYKNRILSIKITFEFHVCTEASSSNTTRYFSGRNNLHIKK